MQLDPERTYLREAPYGSMDPDERLELLDAEGIDAVVLYTTVGLLWEAELEDVELSQAYTRAYNRWICEFCAGQRPPRPHRPPLAGRPEGGGHGARAGRRRGRQGRLRRPFTHDGRPLGHPDNDPVFAAAQDLGVPFAIHPTFEPQWTKGTRMGGVGERARAAPPRLGDRVGRRPPPVHDAVRLRRVRPVPAARRCSSSSPAAGGSATGSTASTRCTATRSSARGCR